MLPRLLTIFSVLRVLGLKKASKFELFLKSKTKILIFEYFPKIPSKMISTHPFYPILIPNTAYVKNFILHGKKYAKLGMYRWVERCGLGKEIFSKKINKKSWGAHKAPPS